MANRTERLRLRVEADSDTTAAALRTISATFDNTLAGGAGSDSGMAVMLQAHGARAVHSLLHGL